MRPVANRQKEETEEVIATFTFDWRCGNQFEEVIEGINNLKNESLERYPDLLPLFKLSNNRDRSICVYVRRLETDEERDKRVGWDQEELDRRYDNYLDLKKEFEEWERVN